MKGERAFIDHKEMSNKFSKSIVNKINNINDAHNIVLIGKDGRLKNSYSFNIDLDRILIDVDAMPMRKNEIRMRNMNLSK